jgi:hypothetical protein
MRSDTERLQDLLEAIERIERYSARGREAFYQDELFQTWVVHHLLIIGEAAERLSCCPPGQSVGRSSRPEKRDKFITTSPSIMKSFGELWRATCPR